MNVRALGEAPILNLRTSPRSSIDESKIGRDWALCTLQANTAFFPKNRRFWMFAALLLVFAPGCASMSWPLPTTDISPERKSRDQDVIAAFERKRARAEYEVAVARLREGNVEAAEERLVQLLRHQPNHTDGALRLVEIYLSTDRLAEAFDLLQALVQRESANAEVQHAMALLLETSGQLSGATAYYRRAVELAPDNELFALDYETALRQRSQEVSYEPREIHDRTALPDENADAPAAGDGSDTALTNEIPPAAGSGPATTIGSTSELRKASFRSQSAEDVSRDSHIDDNAADLTGTERRGMLRHASMVSSGLTSADGTVETPNGGPLEPEEAIDESVYITDVPRDPSLSEREDSLQSPSPRKIAFSAHDASERQREGSTSPPRATLPAMRESDPPANDRPSRQSRQSSAPRSSITTSTSRKSADWVFQARHLLRRGAPQAALARCRRAMADNPDDPQIPILAATLLIEYNEPEAAIVLLEEPLQRFPRNAVLHRILGVAHYRAGSYTQSVSELRRSLSLDKSNALSYFLLGLALDKVGRHRDAVQHYRHAARLDPSLPIAR